MKNSYPRLIGKLLSCSPADLLPPAITVFELEYGTEKNMWGEATRQKPAMFLAPFNIIPFAADDAVAAGQIRGFLEHKGAPIDPYDVQIAARPFQEAFPSLRITSVSSVVSQDSGGRIGHNRHIISGVSYKWFSA